MLNTVFANDVRQTLDHFRRSVDQMFDAFTAGYPQERTAAPYEGMRWTFSPVLETGWDEKALHLRAILPGVSESDLNVNLQGNQLLISGERRAPEGFKKNAFTQLTYGKFQTACTLPDGLDVEKLTCRLQNGVLDIEVPMSEALRPRQIPIQVSGSQQKAISA